MKRDITIETPDGNAGASIFRGDNANGAGVILYMDAFGPRPALDEMCERLSRIRLSRSFA